jgi:ABC-2 type transport system permease protein
MVKRILLVLQREYISRVKKRSFIIMTFLTPLLIALFYGIAFYIVYSQQKEQSAKRICVFDPSGYFINQLSNGKSLIFEYRNTEYDTSFNFAKEGFDACLVLHYPDSSAKEYRAMLYTRESLSISDQSRLERKISDKLYADNLKRLNISKDQLEGSQVSVNIDIRKWNNGLLEESSSGAATGIGLASSILIYLFIFIYGTQVMRGVIEEKTNRIVEVIISSVKPFELMMGKILGMALVALTQMALWVILSGAAMGVVTRAIGSQMHLDSPAAQAMDQGSSGAASGFNMLHMLYSLPLGVIAASFIFYFIFGYLFYGALFAAIGSAVDSETEVQQFTLPVSMPLVFSLIITQSVIGTSPNGQLIKWMSIIPFSSPVAMMARIPFLDAGSYWQLGVSMLVMIISFVVATWIASRIYRTGILMYGKKASWKEIIRWLFYKG